MKRTFEQDFDWGRVVAEVEDVRPDGSCDGVYGFVVFHEDDIPVWLQMAADAKWQELAEAFVEKELAAEARDRDFDKAVGQ